MSAFSASCRAGEGLGRPTALWEGNAGADPCAPTRKKASPATPPRRGAGVRPRYPPHAWGAQSPSPPCKRPKTRSLPRRCGTPTVIEAWPLRLLGMSRQALNKRLRRRQPLPGVSARRHRLESGAAPSAAGRSASVVAPVSRSAGGGEPDSAAQLAATLIFTHKCSPRLFRPFWRGKVEGWGARYQPPRPPCLRPVLPYPGGGEITLYFYTMRYEKVYPKSPGGWRQKAV